MKKILASLVLLVLSACGSQEIRFPSNIHPGQAMHEVNLQGQTYLLVARKTIWNSLMDVPQEFTTTYAGFLEKNRNHWIPFVQILGPEKNNPLQLWQEGDQWYFSVVDTGGAGSGEGYAKLFASQNRGETWELLHCWYYVPEQAPILSVKDAAVQQKQDLIQATEDGGFLLETLVSKDTGEKTIVVLDACLNAELKRVE